MDTSAVQDTITVQDKKVPFLWEGANVYFLLTDRFNNGNKENDVNFERTNPTGKLRGFMGGDLEGITQKIEEGYFKDLGVNAIWFTPVVEQIHGDTDEETGIPMDTMVIGPRTGPSLILILGQKKILKIWLKQHTLMESGY